MLWKKLLLEASALGGFGGGVGGWLGRGRTGIRVETEDSSLNFWAEEGLKVRKDAERNIKANSGVVEKLNHTVLNSWRWRSEGVGEDLLYIEGWDRGGTHKIVESKEHSQGKRDLWGGRKVDIKGSWFGPREMDREVKQMRETKKSAEKKSYWPILQEAGGFLEEKDLRGVSEHWRKRSLELESEILELYKPRWWWESSIGKKTKSELIDLEFQLDAISKITSKNEEELIKSEWKYGALMKNPKIDLVRKFGNVEGTAFNYLKKLAWPNGSGVNKLKEKNIALAVSNLITGDQMGFVCETGKYEKLVTYFYECLNDSWVQKKGVKLVSVIKTVASKMGKYIPTQSGGGGWAGQQDAKADWKDLYKMDDISKTYVLDEKCEEGGLWATIWDTSFFIFISYDENYAK